MSRHGFTLIELTVVVAFIALFATMVVPNLASQKSGRERRAFYGGVARLVVDARETAIETNRSVSLRYDDSNRELFVEQEAEDGMVYDVDGTVVFPEYIRTEAFRVDLQNTASQDWAIRFYPDGTSDGGGLEVTDENLPRSFEITHEGFLRIIDGNLPDPNTERWRAGENEQRI